MKPPLSPTAPARPITRQLGIFAKYWEVGKVKTRLAATLGAPAASEIYHAMLFHLIETLESAGDRRHLVVSPPNSLGKFAAAVPSAWELTAQTSGDLGQRMQSFFEASFQYSPGSSCDHVSKSAHLEPVTPGSRDVAPVEVRTVVIGADCPSLDVSIIDAAFRQLDTAEVVIGPSLDGGYYLIAMKNRCLPIFTGIKWSTPAVLSETIKLLQQQEVRFERLPPFSDIDDAADLNAFFQELTKQRETHALTPSAERLWETIERHR